MNSLKKILNFVKARYAPRGARISFSGSGEDLIIHDFLKKNGINKPLYIDIGAYHPVYGSNTYLFYLQGGRGVLVEPNSAMCRGIKRKRPLDKCLNSGVGREDGESEFYSFQRETRSTFSKEEKEAWEKKSGEIAKIERMSLISLESLVRDYCEGAVPDLISIDTEGYEVEILSSFNWKYRPKVFCIEMVSSSGEENNEIHRLMLSNGYHLYAKTSVNSIYIDKK